MTIKWNKERKEGFGSRLKRIFRSKEPIKPRFEFAQRELSIQINKLQTIYLKLQEKDQMLFNRIVRYVQDRDQQSAAILSRELAQVRKIKSMVNYAKLALEQINLRTNTMTELGEVTNILFPTIAIVKSIKDDINNMMPEVGNEMNEISDVLNEIMVDTSDIPVNNPLPINQIANDEEVQKILSEATAIVEDDVKSKIPELPTSMQVMSKKANKKARRYPDLPSSRKKKVEMPS